MSQRSVEQPRSSLRALFTPLVSASLAALCSAEDGARAVDFQREVRPLLTERCYGCHGPDAATREADLRLDRREHALAQRDGVVVIAPGAPDASALMERILAEDDGRRMPYGEEPLAPAEVELLRRWIEEGASWPEHWSFLPPERTTPPVGVDPVWGKNELDAFLIEGLRQRGLTPAPASDGAMLLRRLAFDLTGLPPSPEELDAFLADPSEEAYLAQVDRLLASPRYGERQAQAWLDLARYADTSGYHEDGPREMWRWREWVIDALNANMPYDQFSLWQLAGDLLPEATEEQRLATGFHRNHPMNSEAGSEPDEYRSAYVMDRVDTTATVWMGLTLGCARCHDHKYDPFSQREYYQLYAFFNQVPEEDSGGFRGNAEPRMRVPREEQREEWERLEREVERLEAWFEADAEELDAAQADWEPRALEALGEPFEWIAMAPTSAYARGGTEFTILEDASVRAEGPSPVKDVYELLLRPGPGRLTGLRLEVFPEERNPEGGSGRSREGSFVLNELELVASSVSDSGEGTPVIFLRGESDIQTGNGDSAGEAVDGNEGTGWSLRGPARSEPHAAVFLPAEPLELNEFSVLRVTLRFTNQSVFKSTIGHLRVSRTEDERLERRMMPVMPRNWWVVGPFPAEESREAYETEYEVEPSIAGGIDLEEEFVEFELEDEDEESSRRRRVTHIGWEERTEWRDGGRETVDGRRSAYYFVRTLDADRARDVRLTYAGGEALRFWLNGELVHSDDAKIREREERKRNRDKDDDDEPALAAAPPAADGVPVPEVEVIEEPDPEVRLSLREGENELVVKFVTGRTRGGARFGLLPVGADRISIAAEAALRAQAADPDSFVRPEAADYEEATGLFALFGFYADDEDERPLPVRRAADLRSWYRREVDPRGEENLKAWEAARSARREYQDEVPQVMVMSDEEERETHILLRGRYDMPGELVEAGVPGVLPPLEDGEQANRLTLARWLLSGEHPLTARVAVNRAWAQYFGRGLVESVEDFGTRGELPTHPELLDWLALWFVDSGWDQKALHRLIVTSDAYRQSSRARAEVAESDPFNHALARMPRRRLSAEAIRDNALWASGLLVEELGGESVRPPQPSGLWAAVSQGQRYSRSKDEQQYRRGLYVYWKRGMLYPSLATFDAPMRESCTPSRVQTNTPLQALVLLNDPVWIEFARNLAERMLREGGEEDAQRLAWGFRLCTSRAPSAAELEVLVAALAEQREHWDGEGRDAKRFLKVGDSEYDEEVELEELAAWTSLGNVLLNLDATIHQG